MIPGPFCECGIDFEDTLELPTLDTVLGFLGLRNSLNLLTRLCTKASYVYNRKKKEKETWLWYSCVLIIVSQPGHPTSSKFLADNGDKIIHVGIVAIALTSASSAVLIPKDTSVHVQQDSLFSLMDFGEKSESCWTCTLVSFGITLLPDGFRCEGKCEDYSRPQLSWRLLK